MAAPAKIACAAAAETGRAKRGKGEAGFGKSPAEVKEIAGAARVARRLGLAGPAALIAHYPSRYENRAVRRVAELRDGDEAVLAGTVTEVRRSNPKPGLHVVTAVLRALDGVKFRATWFRNYTVYDKLAAGMVLAVYGKAQVHERYGVSVTVSDWVTADGGIPPGFLGLRPVYPLVAGVSQDTVRAAVDEALAKHAGSVEENLPRELLFRYRLMGRREAVTSMHHPGGAEAAAAARRRLAYEELFFLQLAMRLRTDSLVRTPKAHSYRPGTPKGFLERLSFRLTAAQARVWEDIRRDMDGSYPMNRLLLGDVGCGKTVVVALAMLKAAESGHRAVFMAPTDTLARQHQKYLARLYYEEAGLPVEIGLVTGAVKSYDPYVPILVGTHALFSEGTDLGQIHLVVIDEQHRFGVEQRAALMAKAGRPDMLTMTATPIPRTLALTAYGDMDLSVIDEMPPGRLPTRTVVTRDRERALAFAKFELDRGNQVYVVCPLVEESEAVDLENATALFTRLRAEFRPHSVGLLHGRMPAADKDEVLTAFREGRTRLLVSTTVIEVGIDVADATAMIVLDADRFGLAQLHQLRGRVGRGAKQSTCVLVSEARTEAAVRRLKAMREHADGFRLAEVDLEMRGPGEFFGTRQAGAFDMKVASLSNVAMVEAARKDARRIEITSDLRRAVEDRFGAGLAAR